MSKLARSAILVAASWFLTGAFAATNMRVFVVANTMDCSTTSSELPQRRECGNAIAEASNAPNPTAYSSVISDPTGGGVSQVDIVYYLTVSGPATAPVPTHIHGFAAISGFRPFQGAYVNAYSYVTVQDTATGVVLGDFRLVENSGAVGPFNSRVDINDVIQVVPGHEIAIYVDTWAVSTVTGSVVTATADPYFEIDYGFSQINPGYAISLSPGANNVPVSQVPELPPILYLLTGGTLLAKTRYRRAKQVVQPNGAA